MPKDARKLEKSFYDQFEIVSERLLSVKKPTGEKENSQLRPRLSARSEIIKDFLTTLNEYTQSQRILPELISQKWLIRVSKTQPDLFNKLIENQDVLERLKKGNVSERREASKVFEAFKTKFVDPANKNTNPALESKIFLNLTGNPLLALLEKVASYPKRITDYQNSKKSSTLDEKRKNVLRDFKLGLAPDLNDRIEELKKSFVEMEKLITQGLAYDQNHQPTNAMLKAKSNQEQAADGLNKHFSSLLTKIDLALNFEPVHRHHFFSGKAIKGEPTSATTLLTEYKSAIEDARKELKITYPELVEAKRVTPRIGA